MLPLCLQPSSPSCPITLAHSSSGLTSRLSARAAARAPPVCLSSPSSPGLWALLRQVQDLGAVPCILRDNTRLWQYQAPAFTEGFWAAALCPLQCLTQCLTHSSLSRNTLIKTSTVTKLISFYWNQLCFAEIKWWNTQKYPDITNGISCLKTCPNLTVLSVLSAQPD